MADSSYELGLVDAVKAEALGVPGHRRFRVLVDGPGGNACLWLEKDQLFRLSIAIQQLLSTLPSEEAPESSTVLSSMPSAHREASIELEVGNLSLGHDPGRGIFLIEAHNREDEPGGQVRLVFLASRTQMEDFAEEAQEVCAAGRPLCPVCNGPIDPEGHVCPRSNGHRTF